MEYNLLTMGNTEAAEIVSDEPIIRTVQDALDLMANVRARSLILRKENFDPAFFDLNTGLLGEILQKFTNYQVRLAVVGDFSKASKNFQAFFGGKQPPRQILVRRIHSRNRTPLGRVRPVLKVRQLMYNSPYDNHIH